MGDRDVCGFEGFARVTKKMKTWAQRVQSEHRDAGAEKGHRREGPPRRGGCVTEGHPGLGGGQRLRLRQKMGEA